MAWKQVGSIRMSKDKEDGTPGKLYINLHGSKTKDGRVDNSGLDDLISALKDPGHYGISLQIEKPEAKIRRLAELGYLEEDKIEQRLNNIPDWLKYEISLPPKRDS